MKRVTLIALIFNFQFSIFNLCAVEPMPLHEVRLLPDSRWQENVQRDSAWMCSLTTQQMLHSFRTTAGVFSAYEGGYDNFTKMGGWESLD